MGEITIDCANGVGSLAAEKFSTRLSDRLQLKIVNNGNGVLNKDCGADFVKTGQRAPLGMQLENGKRYCSLDGDADRLGRVLIIFAQDLNKYSNLPAMSSI